MRLLGELPTEFQGRAAQAFMAVLQSGAASSVAGAAESLTSSLLATLREQLGFGSSSTSVQPAEASWTVQMNREVTNLNQLLLQVVSSPTVTAAQRDRFSQIESTVLTLLTDLTHEDAIDQDRQGANLSGKAETLITTLRNLVTNGRNAATIGNREELEGFRPRTFGPFYEFVTGLRESADQLNTAQRRTDADTALHAAQGASQNRWMERFRDPSLVPGTNYYALDETHNAQARLRDRSEGFQLTVENPLMPQIQSLLQGGDYRIAAERWGVDPINQRPRLTQDAGERALVTAYRAQFLQPMWNLVVSAAAQLRAEPLQPDHPNIARMRAMAVALRNEAGAFRDSLGTGTGPVQTIIRREYQIVDGLLYYLNEATAYRGTDVDYARRGQDVPRTVAGFEWPVTNSANQTVRGTLQIAGPWRPMP